jgi:NAD(P)-dependent dehydrogenase (short-subunit alcohol dehydrogenase family)
MGFLDLKELKPLLSIIQHLSLNPSTMTSPVALIFGAGAKVGNSVAKTFLAKGYNVALASRSQNPETSTANELHIPTDCADTDSVLQAFAKVRSVFGHPSVVIYNGS